MRSHRPIPPAVAPALLLVLGAWAPGCQPRETDAGRTVGPQVIVIRLPRHLGEPERPAVEFDHARHAAAHEKEGCATCHPSERDGTLVPLLGRRTAGRSRDALMDHYHDRCLGCHRQRQGEGKKTGPRLCGACHVRRATPRVARVAMRFDYSLHYRHVRALKERCQDCHHEYDKKQRRLVYRKGREEGCASCHGAKDEGRSFSLRNAAHRACITCHRQRQEKRLKSGPDRCLGCHDARRQAAIKRITTGLPRLERNQPDMRWLRAPGAKTRLVAFNHEAHEPRVGFCSSCHHKTLEKCRTCHTLPGDKKGDGVTLEQAYHRSTSTHSCVGCHHRTAATKDCAGCHQALGAPPSQRSCVVCHTGPLPRGKAVLPARAFPPEVALKPLPRTSDDFPATVLIKRLAREYKPTLLPHLKMVLKLDAIVRGSPLARQFHGVTEVTCAACHHRSPVGRRPAACASCHGPAAHRTRDQPGLRVAYHRQCIGCHQRMGIKEQGCTDCHEKQQAGRGGRR